jgi:hypothetical protein
MDKIKDKGPPNEFVCHLVATHDPSGVEGFPSVGVMSRP